MSNKKEKTYKYFINKNNEIYKTCRNYLIKISPWKSGEDRRLFRFEQGGLKEIKKRDAIELSNRLWDLDERVWQFGNNYYKVFNSVETNFSYTLNNDSLNWTKHKFEHTGKGFDGKDYVYYHFYYLCMYKGKLYWAAFHYYPRVTLYKFSDINTEPSYDDFAQWSSAKHCKLIYNISNLNENV